MYSLSSSDNKQVVWHGEENPPEHLKRKKGGLFTDAPFTQIICGRLYEQRCLFRIKYQFLRDLSAN